jgi:hypothetical protein
MTCRRPEADLDSEGRNRLAGAAAGLKGFRRSQAKDFRDAENPARWGSHLNHLLQRPSKLCRGHHAAMPYEDVAACVAKLRMREAPHHLERSRT